MLTNAASAAMGVSPDELEIQNRAFVLVSDPSKSMSLAEVAALPEAWSIPDDLEVTLKSQEAFKFIGQSQPRNDILAKVTGQAVYGYDARIEGCSTAQSPVHRR